MTVEAAFVLPVAFFLIFGLVTGAMGIFRFQEVAYLAREGARYASTHGAQYRLDTGKSVGTATDWKNDIKTNGIMTKRLVLDPDKINVEISWPPVINQPDKPDNWPGSRVTVKVSYQWIPEAYLIGPVTLTSTSSMIITN
jgi:Flp pilus assembly protein TadG